MLITYKTRKTTNRIQAICVAAPAIPDSPNTPAMSPRIKKVSDQLNIKVFPRLGLSISDQNQHDSAG
jgi:hypothetical protein